jgi:tripartite-type tricarboxylate transporter receptor subunit TctC
MGRGSARCKYQARLNLRATGSEPGGRTGKTMMHNGVESMDTSKYTNAPMRLLAAGILMASAVCATAQQAYPNKPIRFISPNPPGGGTSIIGRLVGQKFTDSWGQQVILENRPGGNGFIGGEALAKSPPDGHTLMVITSTFVITPALYPPPYDPIRDFAAVATLTNSELLLLVHPSVPANNLREFIALAKAKPGQLNYGSSGSGAITRLAGAFFDMMTGTRMQNISYKGTGQAMTDLLGGQVQLSFSVPPPAIPHVQAGKLRAIAVSGESRLSSLPQVPTFTEAGLSGFDVSSWYGLVAPAGTPKAVIDKLSAEIAKILVMPDIKEKIDAQGQDPFISTPERFAEIMKRDLAKYAKIIKDANIKTDE